MQARFYDPVIGRFLSNDPVGFSPDRPDMFGRYTYVANDPVNMVDPDGRNPVGGAIAGGILGGIVSAGLEIRRQLKSEGGISSLGKIGSSFVSGGIAGAITGAAVGAGVPALGSAIIGANYGSLAAGANAIAHDMIENGSANAANTGEAMLNGAVAGAIPIPSLKGQSAGVKGALSGGGAPVVERGVDAVTDAVGLDGANDTSASDYEEACC